MLGKIHNRCKCKPDIDHIHAAGKKPDDKSKAQILAIGSKIMPDNNLLCPQDSSQISPIALSYDQKAVRIDLFAQKPTKVVFPESVGRYERIFKILE